MPLTVNHPLTATTPDNTAYEIRPSHWNSGHAATLNAVGSEISGAFSNTNGVSFGLETNGRVTASYTVPGATVFSNSNNVSFGLNGSTVTATATFAQTNQSIGLYAVSNTTGAASSTTVDARSLSFQGAGVASVGMTNGSVVISVPAGGGAGDGGVGISAGASSVSSGNVIFSNSNGVSFGLNGSTLTASHNGITTARASTDAIGLNTAQTNVTWTVNSSGLSLNASGYAGTATAITGRASITLNSGGLSFNGSALAGTGTAVTGGATLTLNSSGLSFNGSGLAGTNTAVTGGAAITLNSSGLSFNGASLAGTTSGFTGANLSATITHNTAGLALSMSAAAPGAATLTVSAVGNTTVNSSGTWPNALSIRAYGIASVGTSNGSLLISTPDAAEFTQLSVGNSNLGNTAGDTGVFTGRLVLVGSSNITLSGSSNGASQTISIIGAAGGNGVALYDGANSITSGTARFTNANGVSFTFNGQTISGSVNTSYRASNDAIGLNTAQTNVTWTVNSSGLSLNASGYAGTATAITGRASITLNSAGMSFNGSALAGTGTAVTGGATLTLNSSGLSFNGSGLAGTNTAVTGGAAITLNTAGLSFNGASLAGTSSGFTGANISASITHNTAGLALSMSVAAPGAAAEANAINLLGANTAGNTTATGSTIGWSGVNLTLSGTNDSQIVVSAPATSSLVGVNGISVSTNGSTISIQPTWQSFFENVMAGPNQTMTFNGASVSHAVAFVLPENISGSYIRLPVLMTTNSTTIATTGASRSVSGAIYSTWNAVVYSLGTGASSRSLQSVASGSNGWTFMNSLSIAANGTQYSVTQGFSANAEGAGTTRTTQYSISNTNYSLTTNQIATEWSSGRYIDIPFANSLSAGAYWLVIGMSTSSATNSAGAWTDANVRYSNHFGVTATNMAFGVMGSTNLTSTPFAAGSFSTAGGGTTASIPLSAISSSASHVRPYFQIIRQA